MNAADNVLRFLVRLMVWVAGLLMALMMMQVTLDVVLRTAISRPIPGTLEIVANYYMVALIFLPLGLVTYGREHIVVELFTRGLSPRALASLTLFGNLLAVAYSGAIAYFGALEAIDMTRIGESWSAGVGEITIWPARWLVPVGCSVMASYFLLHALDDLACLVRGERALDSKAREALLYD